MDIKQYDESTAQNIISAINSMKSDGYELTGRYSDTAFFSETVKKLLDSADETNRPVDECLGCGHMLSKTLKNIKASAKRLLNGEYREESRGSKIQFELVPLIEEAYLYAVYYLWAVTSEERMAQYEKEIPELCSNKYINKAEETGEYKYESAFIITGYNKLDYTKMCVESLLNNIPNGLNYELILINHGSSDGTKEYFESISPTKQLDLEFNGGGRSCVIRMIESKYMLSISNDVIIGKNAIENMIACVNSDSRIAWAVPSTPNVSNYQAIPVSYSCLSDFEKFASENNISDPFRWEQRTRLMNPIDIKRTSVYYGRNGILPNGCFKGASSIAFPDDRLSLLTRRNGYMMMLIKDAYCHHFGSITIKDEVKKAVNADMYEKGRATFKDVFGIDPWGPGRCYDSAFFNQLVGNSTGHADILGMNCGIGANALKIKEQLKEYCHNTDTCLYNVVDETNEVYIPDLKGIGGNPQKVSTIKEFKDYLYKHNFRYIVWDMPFMTQYKFETLLKACLARLAPKGRIFMRINEQSRNISAISGLDIQNINNEWIIIMNK